MIKKIFLIILLFLYNPIAHASIWDDIGKCFNDPCNCGDSKKRTETWNGTSKTFNENRNCPPWNRSDGRNNNVCLLKKNYPNAGIDYYENICAEETSESTYLLPKIKIRGQQCNALACWSTKNTLKWNGDCITLVGGYALPMHRVCARPAFPADPVKNTAQDPGYTNHVHLNYEGAEKPDEPVYDVDGEIIDIEIPKLCAYNDPSLLTDPTTGDVMDLDNGHQPFHKTNQVHPIVEAIIFLLPFDMVSSLFDLIGGGEDAGEWNDLLSFVADVISWVGDLIGGFLAEVGQINRVVDGSYGCVNIPLGPMPPPFCPTISSLNQTAITQRICHQDNVTGAVVESVEGMECVVSNLNNNFINNSVRIGYENFIPLCKNGENPLLTDKCINITNLELFASAKVLHASTARKDIIKHCNNANSGEVCVQTMLPHKCSVSANGCQDGFRVVYGTKMGGATYAQSYFRDDIADCTSSATSICQEIWGINTGEFIDVSLKFPTIQTLFAILPLTANTQLADKTGKATNFNVSIVRIPSFRTTYEFTQETNQICAFDTTNILIAGCEERARPSKPKIYDCASNAVPGISCSSTYFNPQFIVSYEHGSNKTSALMIPYSVHNSASFEYTINLAGDNFGSFVTDDSFTIKPFSGTHAPSPTTIFGEYRDNIYPVSGSTVNNNAVYLTGLEYVNGAYYLGGKYACLESYDLPKCPDNPKACILSNLLNRDTVKCSTFNAKSSELGLSLCTPLQNLTCAKVDSIPKIAGGVVNIRGCIDGIKCYENSVELCKVSYAAADRYLPSPSLGNTLSDSQYYDITALLSYNNILSGFSINYDTDKYGLRGKTAIELGLCIAIPQGTCSALTGYTQANGYANWPSVQVGNISNGTCQPSWTERPPLERYCVPVVSSKTFVLEDMYGNIGCDEPTVSPPSATPPPPPPPSSTPPNWTFPPGTFLPPGSITLPPGGFTIPGGGFTFPPGSFAPI